MEMSESIEPDPTPGAVDLFWLPLGAGGYSVRLNGRVFEAVAARVQHRSARDLYHAALEFRLPLVGGSSSSRHPSRTRTASERGVVVEGPVGARWAGRVRSVPVRSSPLARGRDPRRSGGRRQSAAAQPPIRSSHKRSGTTYRKLPTPVWGRDELRTGEMWNSNSIISWLITRSGLRVESIRPPTGGRAPGWHAGIVVARRDRSTPA